jgi:K+-sensing histidine kinase KdpD
MGSPTNKNAQLIAALASDTAELRRKDLATGQLVRSRWMPYVLAVMLTAGILSLHGAIGLASSDPPILDMFLIPVVVSAYLGGLIPGLFATLTATLVTDFFLPPAHTFVIDGLHNRLDWGRWSPSECSSAY